MRVHRSASLLAVPSPPIRIVLFGFGEWGASCALRLNGYFTAWGINPPFISREGANAPRLSYLIQLYIRKSQIQVISHSAKRCGWYLRPYSHLKDVLSRNVVIPGGDII